MLKPEFEKMERVHTAIKDLDRIKASNTSNGDKFDDIVNALKEIDKNEFDNKNLESVIDTIRESLVKIYIQSSMKLDNIINVNHSETELMILSENQRQIPNYIPPKKDGGK